MTPTPAEKVSSPIPDEVTEKEVPHIPAGKTFADFRAFSQAGRDLAHWHLTYETVPMMLPEIPFVSVTAFPFSK